MSDHERANRLYWESESSVNDIAERLDLSKSSLYNLIEPLAADVDCPDCGAMLEYPNRTALDRGLMQCPECGREGITADDLDGEYSPPTRRSTRSASDSDRASVFAYEPADRMADRQALVGAGLLGAAALIWLLRRA